MSEEKQGLGGLLGNIQQQASGLVDGLKEGAEKVIGKENMEKVAEVLNTDVGEMAGDALEGVKTGAEVLKDKAEDVVEDLREGASNVVGKENLEKVGDVLNTDVGEIAGDLTEKAGGLLGGIGKKLGEQVEKVKDALDGDDEKK